MTKGVVKQTQQKNVKHVDDMMISERSHDVREWLERVVSNTRKNTCRQGYLNFFVDGPNVVSSLVIRSAIPWDTPVPQTAEQHFRAVEAFAVDSNDCPERIGTTLLEWKRLAPTVQRHFFKWPKTLMLKFSLKKP